MTIEHTPIPWRVFTEETDDGENIYPILMTEDFDEEIFPYGGRSSQAFANNEFIVKCVNNFDNLLQSSKHLEENTLILLNALDHNYFVANITRLQTVVLKCLHESRQAINKAEKE